jgi:hypothetical protein
LSQEQEQSQTIPNPACLKPFKGFLDLALGPGKFYLTVLFGVGLHYMTSMLKYFLLFVCFYWGFTPQQLGWSFFHGYL